MLETSVKDSLAGRNARSPGQIPRHGWLVIVRRVLGRIQHENLSIIAAGVSFFGFLAIFPLVIATVSIYGLLADPNAASQHIGILTAIIPREAADVVRDQLGEIVHSSSNSLGSGAIISILVALYASMQGTKTLIEGMNIVYNEKEKRGYFKRSAVALLFSLGAALFVIVALALIAVVPAALNIIGLGRMASVISNLIRWPLLAVAIVIGLALLNRYGPSRRKPRWRWISWGTSLSAIVWLVGSLAFSYYVDHFGNYNKIYGGLAGVIILLTWFYLTSYVVLVGATFNAETEFQTARIPQ